MCLYSTYYIITFRYGSPDQSKASRYDGPSNNINLKREGHHHSDSGSDENNEDIFNGKNDNDIEEEVEDLQKKEEELQAELNFATL